MYDFQIFALTNRFVKIIDPLKAISNYVLNCMLFILIFNYAKNQLISYYFCIFRR